MVKYYPKNFTPHLFLIQNTGGIFMVKMTTRRGFRPKLQSRSLPTVAKKTSSTLKSGQNFLKKASDKVAKAEKLRDTIADQPIKTLMMYALKAAKNEKTPVGANGKNLLPVDARSIVINGGATGDVTSTMSMYMYRPPRKRSVDSIQYAMKTMASRTIGSGENVQSVFDINLLDAIEVENNNAGDAKYSNLTVKKAFNKYIQTTYNNLSGNAYTAKLQQTSIHFKSMSNELIITNNNDTSVMIDVYELVPQHSLGPSAYASENLATGYMSPRWTFEEGLGTNADTLMLQDNMDATDLAANPFNSTVFSRTWKVVKQLRLNITGGSTHRHKSVYEINKTVSYQEMAQVSPNGGKFAGWNPVFMCVQRGVPAQVLGATKEAVASSTTYVSNMQLNYEANPEAQAKVIVYDSNT